MFRRKGKKLERRTESDGQKIHMRKKGQSQKQLWGNDVQSIRQRSEKEGSSEAAEPPDQSTPVVSVKTLISLMLPLILSTEEIVLVSEHSQKES